MIRHFLAVPVLLSGFAQTTAPGQASKDLTLEILYHPEQSVDLDGSPPNIVGWMQDGTHYIRIETEDSTAGKSLYRVEALTGKEEPLYDLEQLRRALSALPGIGAEEAERISQTGEFTPSPDERSVLILYHDDLFYFDLVNNRASRLTSTPGAEEVPSFSPDSKSIAFIRNHDLYVIATEEPEERRLTSDGRPDLFNGILDWVYQEEIYGRGNYRGYWWSPDSRSIAFLQLDETRVPEFTLVDQISRRPKLEVTRYPRAGDPNPLPRLGIVSASGGETRWVDLSTYNPEDLLIVRAGWTPDSRNLVFQVQNREQTWLDLNLVAPDGSGVRRMLRETTPAWVDVLEEPCWLEDGTFLWLSERDGWRHLYHHSQDGQLIRKVTSGHWEVREFHGFDKREWLYFSATERSHIGLDLYRMRLDGTGLTRISEREGTHSVQFNEQLTRYIDRWSDIQTPTRTTLHDNAGNRLRVIDENPPDELEKYRLSEPEFLQVRTRDGFPMEAMIIKPPDFDPGQSYPVLSYTYAGPHAPIVRNAWGGTGYLWHQLLAQKGYIIWFCDNRSASGKGVRSAWPVHRRLGELELQDLQDGFGWLREQPWVDGERIGLWGWSYGGYMTAYALTRSRDLKIGIAGAPVTDWELYDTIYTERYMGTPSGNPDGYASSSVLTRASELHGRMLLLHGTLDDNVHPQNSVRLMYELQKAGKQFQVMFYPGSRHGVQEKSLVYHMRKLMTDFVLRQL